MNWVSFFNVNAMSDLVYIIIYINFSTIRAYSVLSIDSLFKSVCEILSYSFIEIFILSRRFFFNSIFEAFF